MSWDHYDTEFETTPAEDPSKPVPDGIYSVRVKSVSASSSRNGRDVFKWDLPITGCANPANLGHVKRMLFLNDFLDKPESMARLKTNLLICGAQHLRPSMLKDPQAIECLLDLDLEVAVVNKEARDGSGKMFSNVYLRRLLPGPLVCEGVAIGASGANGTGGAAVAQGDSDLPF